MLLSAAVDAVTEAAFCNEGLGARYLLAVGKRHVLGCGLVILPGGTVAGGIAGQGFQVMTDRLQVVIRHELGRVVEGIRHRAEDDGMAVPAALEEGVYVLLAPAAKTGIRVAAQARRIPAVEKRAGKIERAAFIERFFRHGDGARRMTAAAMTRPLNEIGATVPLVVAGGFRLIGAAFGEDGVPERERPAHVHRPLDVRGPVFLLNGCDPAGEIGVERADVVVAHLHIRGVRHCRIEAVTVGCHALTDGAVEIGERIVADAGLLVRGDVGREDGAERRSHLQPAGKGCAFRCAVTGNAVAQAGDIFTALHQFFRGGLRCSDVIEGGCRLARYEPRDAAGHKHDNQKKNQKKSLQGGALMSLLRDFAFGF